MGVPHFLVAEPQEVDAYRDASRGSLATVLSLDLGYKARYELCDDLGLTKSTGPGPEPSLSLGSRTQTLWPCFSSSCTKSCVVNASPLFSLRM